MDLDSLDITTVQRKALEKKGANTVEELVRILPRKYYDFRTSYPLENIMDGETCAIIGTVKYISFNAAVSCVKLQMREKENFTYFEVKWFNQPYLYEKLQYLYEKEIVVCGTVTTYDNSRQIMNPLYISEDIQKGLRIYPVYPKIQGIAENTFVNIMAKAINQCQEEDSLGENELKTFNLPTNRELLQYIHQPKDTQEIKSAKRRLVFETLYNFAEHLERDKRRVQTKSSIVIKNRTVCDKFIERFPYKLTEDQRSTIETMICKASKGERINALVQGDVGCGKTIVAFIVMVGIVENGYQAALMAPTSVLATQHYNELCSYVEPLGFKVALLKNDTRATTKRKMLSGIKSGEYQFIVGTHSVVSQSVEYRNLGITVVDEEHKFGVAQREALTEKAMSGVHSITMSATPIPRSLALTIYGGAVDVYNITTMPNGRQPIQTAVNNSLPVIYNFMYKQIMEGHQCYVVCPLINENEKMKDVASVDEVYEQVKIHFSQYDIQVGKLTGKMKAGEISEEIGKFAKNEYQILVSTTIVEVGVNVPNATVILIKDAERFGLAGLHQLRGRVGRGTAKSYCILQSSDKENPRLKVMCSTTNGFTIAEEDLKLRGSGDFIGTRQSGENKEVMLLLSHPKLYKNIRAYVSKKIDVEEMEKK